MLSKAFLKGLRRTVIARISGALSWPVRRLLWRLMGSNPALIRRAGRWTWLWQPGWGHRVYEAHYRSAEDPDQLTVRSYEQDKFSHQLELLAGRRFGRGLEVGCAEGVFTAMLAGYCDELVGTDISETAVERGRARCADLDGVRFEQHNLPFEMPDGEFDLIVCSDVLYLWESNTLDFGLQELRSRLRPGGLLLLQHFLGEFGQATHGEVVHDRVRDGVGQEPRLRLLHHERRTGISPWGNEGPGYRIDLYERATAGHDGDDDIDDMDDAVRRRIIR